MRLLPPQLVPILIVVSVAVGVGLPLVGPLPWSARVAGVVVLVAGAALTLRSSRLFAALATNIMTFDDPDRLVTSGPFRVSRNPMYLGFLAVLVGVALLVGTASAAVGPVGFWLAAHFWYVPFEERRMAATFGPDYEVYRGRVGRWITLPGRRMRQLR